MSTVSPPLSLDLDPHSGASPWDDERSTSTPPISLPANSESQGFESTAAPTSPAPVAAASVTKPSAAARRTPRRPGRQIVRAEVIDDTLGPLGPLGDNSEPTTPAPALETPPLPPVKESGIPRASTSASAARESSLSEDVGGDEVASERAEQPQQQAPPQPQKPIFEVAVGDPHKVGDLTSAHTVYQVRTKTTSKAFRVPEFTVSRRYRDFLWLYEVLNSNNPGVVVPPPPEKQAVGRFDENFVESRRAALERMVNRICAHPILLQDNDLKLFLESESLSNDIKHRIHNPPLPQESKGMFGFGGFSNTTKFIETDDWFHERRQYLDALETQLKNLLKSVDGVVKQRKDLSESALDFSSSLHALSTVELSKSLSSPLDHLSSLQLRIQELHERQAAQDILTLGIAVDEYIRIINSIKLAFQQRQKAYQSCHAAETELVKRRQTFEKLQRQGKTQQDRLTQLSAEVADSERKVHQARVLFEDMGRLMRSELERFEKEKVEDFKSAIETWLESAVEAQKELIELWESYLLQLDREEQEDAAEQKRDRPQPKQQTVSGEPAAAPAASEEGQQKAKENEDDDED